MERFEYHRAADARDALTAVSNASYIAGGTNLVDYMTLGVVRPSALVDINALRNTYGQIEPSSQRLRLGALVRMSEAEDHSFVRKSLPVLHQTLSVAASRQIRNMASLGGNLLQRTRCEYYREPSWPCNRRAPGSGCAALEGLNRQHAILGTSSSCIATYAGDFAQALIALEATVETLDGPAARTRRIPIAELHRQPGHSPEIETTLHPGELITFIDVPVAPWMRRSLYVKVRDRESYQFAVASAAVALDLDGDTVREARIALGGVATVPWRAHEAEASLKGQSLTEAAASQAARRAFAAAQPRMRNRFKAEIGQQVLVRALLQARQIEV
jgi:xanthine dehydrogenase YagS FAD-binding subunit